MKNDNFWSIWRILCCSLLFWTVAGVVAAQDNPYKRNKTLLLINSYEENEPWANDISEPIGSYISTLENVTCDMVNLNNSLMTDSIAYSRMESGLFSTYANNHPSYIVMVGNLAFTLRDRIKEEWGDIPILLISSIDKFAPTEKYFTNDDSRSTFNEDRMLREVRNDCNFTTIIVPEYYEETVNLMLQLQPDMEEFVYFSTNIYVQRHIAYEIEDLLARIRPDIKFRWVQAYEENSPVLREYVTERHPKTGLLVAQWVFQKTDINNRTLLTSTDLRLIISSKNPIYSIREPYRMYGCIGGVFDDSDEVHASIRKVVDQMVAGGNMRKIPFVYTKEEKTHLNYRLMTEYNLDEDNCPPETEFYNKPKTYLEQYFWQTLAIGLVAIIVISFMWVKTTNQHKEIQRLNYNTLFLNNMPVPFAKADIIFGNNGHIIEITYRSKNHAYEHLLEINSVPDNPGMLFPVSLITSKVTEMMEQKHNVTFSYHFEKTDTYYEFTLCSVMNKAEKYGTLNVVDIFARDLTTRYKMENSLRRFTNKLDLALSASKVVPWQWNIETDTISFDDRNLFDHLKARKISGDGMDEWEIRFDDFLARIHPEDRGKMIQAKMDIRIGALKKISNLQLRIMTKGTTSLEWVELDSTTTLQSGENKPIYISGSMRIITDKVNADRMLLNALEKAKESDRMKSAFLANMSHEIRTPLNAIVGFSNLLTETTDPQEQADFINIIHRNNDLLLTLVNDVLDLAKIESNTIDLNMASTDVNAIIKAAMNTVQNRVQDGVQLRSNLTMAKCVIESDPIRLSQLFINLLTNACKFTNKGHIEVGYELQEEELYFYVEDTGIGIEKENQGQVFERFVKLNNFAQGTGLGLAICTRLVELMGGKIGVESEGKNKGSKFWFTLPYNPCEVEEEESQENNWIDDNTPEANSNHRDVPVVLVAEDNMSNYMLVAHLLRNNYSLIRATTGLEAVELFKHCNPNLVLMDINMPIMDGYEATRRIREISKTVPIIAVTAYAFESDRKRIMASGFNGYVSKPISFKSIQNAIDRIMGGGKKSQHKLDLIY